MDRGCARLRVELSSYWRSPSLEWCGHVSSCIALSDHNYIVTLHYGPPLRGKGDYFRLGHRSDVHVRKPQVVEGLRGKKIVHVAVGALHCLAVTDSGQVYAWGDNDHGQQGNGTTTVNRKPTLVQGLEGQKITRVACGSSHSVAWTTVDVATPSVHEPVLFQTTRDPLGASYLGVPSDVNSSAASNKISGASNSKPNRPSLAKILLSLDGNLAKQQALSHILTALQIMYARDAVVGALMPAAMIAPVECPSAAASDASAVASPMNGEECMLAVDIEDRLSPNPWQEKREIVSSEDVVTPSAVTPLVLSASAGPFITVTDDLGAASIFAETMTKTEEVADMLLELCVTELEDVATRLTERPPLFSNCGGGE
nr:E3 ubiquitin-protein ligase HERC2-like [Pan paniscus]